MDDQPMRDFGSERQAADTTERAHNGSQCQRRVSSAAGGAAATAQEMTQRARERAAAVGDAIYQRGARAGEYLTQNINQHPLAGLLIAGAIGYGIAYVLHARQRGE